MGNALKLTTTLGGRWYHHYGAAPCPVCQPERRKDQNALTLADGSDGRVLLDCKKSACTFFDILVAAGSPRVDCTPLDAAAQAKREAKQLDETKKRGAQAKRLWIEAQPITGTLAETYLRDGRGITCPLPPTLRFHPETWHGPTAQKLPAMVAVVQGVGLPAVHRTYLSTDGLGKAGLEGGDKLMLGGTRGGAVRLSGRFARLVVAEGIETALSLSCGLIDGPATVWAALSTSGMRGLQLPDQAAQLVIAPDGDEPGSVAAYALAQRAHDMGWKVSTLHPGTGRDFNDILQERGAA
jgi:hypothetical protein